MTKILTADDIVAAPHETKTVDVPGLDGSVYLRALTGAQATFYQCLCKRVSDAEVADYNGVKETLIAMAILDPSGDPMFPDMDVPRVGDTFDRPFKVLGGLPAKALDFLFEAVQEMNLMASEDDDVDAIAGN